ncbi:MAG: type II pantothenate kinase [Saccharofermentanales bacterium]|jgi:type II pantothenate kinase|nr:type II pantothenate kinase [Clostridiaceae bacterium]
MFDLKEAQKNDNGVIIGLDVGGSNTKIIGFHKAKLLLETQVQASDPMASAYGAVGKFLSINNLSLDDVTSINTTGVGASYLSGSFFNCDTRKAPEFDSVGLGGLYTAGVQRAVVVSIGTGTSIVFANGSSIQHVIGSGVGGGTIVGLSRVMLGMRDISSICQMAEDGELRKIDLAVGDLSRTELPGLSMDVTASNFGKVDDLASQEDLALGILNLVFQSIGTASVLVSRLVKTDEIVFTGNLLRMAKGREILARFSDLYNVKIIVPDHAEFATAIGAALYGAKLAHS